MPAAGAPDVSRRDRHPANRRVQQITAIARGDLGPGESVAVARNGRCGGLEAAALRIERAPLLAEHAADLADRAPRAARASRMGSSTFASACRAAAAQGRERGLDGGGVALRPHPPRALDLPPLRLRVEAVDLDRRVGPPVQRLTPTDHLAASTSC